MKFSVCYSSSVLVLLCWLIQLTAVKLSLVGIYWKCKANDTVCSRAFSVSCSNTLSCVLGIVL